MHAKLRLVEKWGSCHAFASSPCFKKGVQGMLKAGVHLLVSGMVLMGLRFLEISAFCNQAIYNVCCVAFVGALLSFIGYYASLKSPFVRRGLHLAIGSHFPGEEELAIQPAYRPRS